MTVSASRTATGAPSIPRPRDAEPALAQDPAVATATAPEPPPAQFPWPEPWRFSLGARPRTEYWDVTTASWHSCGPQTGRLDRPGTEFPTMPGIRRRAAGAAG